MNKKNDTYWEHRKAELIYQQMDKAEAKADDIDKIYNEAQQYLSRQANKVFDKFQRDYGLSETDARQVLKDMRGKQSLSEMRKVLEARPDDPNINQLLADMDSGAYAFRLNRFNELSQQVDRLRNAMYQAEKKQSDRFYPDFMKDSYNRATFDLQQHTGLAYHFNALPEAEIKRLSRLKWSGDNYSGRIWNNTGELARQLKNELLVSWMTGRSNRDVINSISERFNAGRNNARRLVRTESAFFHNEMEALSYKDADIEQYRFVAVLDKRTSAICRKHDNKVYKVSERKTGVNYPPLHPWCRSTTIAHFEDMDLSKLERRARDPETGKTMLVPADMSYDDWHDKYVAKSKDKVYNQDMNNFDLMAKQRSFTVGNDIRVKTKQLSGYDFDFWSQDNTKKIRDTVSNIESTFRELSSYKKPTVVFLKKSRLPGLAGYDYKQDILFVSDALHSEKEFQEVLSDGFFASRSIKDTMVHELTHKKHWDSAKAFYKVNKKRYNNVEQAMSELNSPLVSYVKEQQSIDRRYLKDISLNAYNAFLYHNNINELVAEVEVLAENITDKVLLQKVKEVLSWK